MVVYGEAGKGRGFTGKKTPSTNTDENGEICSESVEFAQSFTKSLQYREKVGEKWAFWLGLWVPDGGVVLLTRQKYPKAF